MEPVLYRNLKAIGDKLKIAVPSSGEPLESNVWILYFDAVRRKLNALIT